MSQKNDGEQDIAPEPQSNGDRQPKRLIQDLNKVPSPDALDDDGVLVGSGKAELEADSVLVGSGEAELEADNFECKRADTADANALNVDKRRSPADADFDATEQDETAACVSSIVKCFAIGFLVAVAASLVGHAADLQSKQPPSINIHTGRCGIPGPPGPIGPRGIPGAPVPNGAAVSDGTTELDSHHVPYSLPRDQPRKSAMLGYTSTNETRVRKVWECLYSFAVGNTKWSRVGIADSITPLGSTAMGKRRTFVDFGTAYEALEFTVQAMTDEHVCQQLFEYSDMHGKWVLEVPNFWIRTRLFTYRDPLGSWNAEYAATRLGWNIWIPDKNWGMAIADLKRDCLESILTYKR